ncbi:YidH family protein [Streptomonospora algeriensis]|uniref:YidH family protein n=1 Tax=Streptomonospora algeriensis TaxID=995084 RepID=A0ABW3BDU5_9ACTN
MAEARDPSSGGPRDTGAEHSGGTRGAEPDYRFTLANERTFLAWIRTALALVAGAVAVLHLVPLDWQSGVRLAVGFALTGLAIVITVYAPLRWVRVQKAMRSDQPLPMSALPAITAVGVALVCAVVLLGNYWP